MVADILHHIPRPNDYQNKKKMMKKILYILLFALTSCKETSHEVRYKPDGTDSVVHVSYYDGNQFNTFYMAYELFKDVYDKEGYEGCYEYCLSHDLPDYWLCEYSKYKKLK